MLVSHLSVVFKQRANQVGENPLPADHYSMVFLLTSLWQKRGCSAYPGTHKKIYFITSRANHKAEVCVCDWKRRSSLSYHGSCAPPVLEIWHKSLLCANAFLKYLKIITCFKAILYFIVSNSCISKATWTVGCGMIQFDSLQVVGSSIGTKYI